MITEFTKIGLAAAFRFHLNGEGLDNKLALLDAEYVEGLGLVPVLASRGALTVDERERLEVALTEIFTIDPENPIAEARIVDITTGDVPFPEFMYYDHKYFQRFSED